MQFKHPEILYALLLLLIPILVHLFQLRRFKKTPFTNVHFLKEAVLQTRKSSQIKKWLILLCRLLVFTFLILAFAQPFTTRQNSTQHAKETVVYIDNSFSMQAKGNRGELLQRIKQDLFENNQLPNTFTWFTNNDKQPQSTADQFRNEVLTIPYTASQYTPQEIMLQAEQLFTEEHTNKELILISDFQHWETFPEYNPDTFTVKTIQVQPVNTQSVSVDSLAIRNFSTAETSLSAYISCQGTQPDAVPVSLYNGEELLAKATASFKKSQQEQVEFKVTSRNLTDARIEVEDPQLPFDNTLYFSLNTSKKINVLSIDAAEATFLQRIFTDDTFSYTSQAVNTPDYSIIPDQHLVVLNGLDHITATLQAALTSFVDNGGTLLVIPGMTIDKTSYNQLLQEVDFGQLEAYEEQSKQLTTIHFSHPVYEGVFENQIQNFQYPTVETSYTLTGNYASVLSFENNQPFLAQRHNVYVFAGSPDAQNSNFKNSPLIVPTLYNIGLKSLALPQPYYIIGQQNSFDVAVSLAKDHILTLERNEQQWIPMQQTAANKVTITTDQLPEDAGIYTVKNKDGAVTQVAFNYSRSENNLRYSQVSDWATAKYYNSIASLFEERANAQAVTTFWKWCILLAFLFLIIEMLILKLIP